MHHRAEAYLTESVYEVVLQKSIPAQIRQLILYHYYESVNFFTSVITKNKLTDLCWN